MKLPKLLKLISIVFFPISCGVAASIKEDLGKLLLSSKDRAVLTPLRMSDRLCYFFPPEAEQLFNAEKRSPGKLIREIDSWEMPARNLHARALAHAFRIILDGRPFSTRKDLDHFVVIVSGGPVKP
jgi:hypothetical protein